MSAEDLDEAIAHTLAGMTEAQKDHYRAIQAALLACYASDRFHGVIIVGSDDPESPDSIELTHMMTINATDIDTVKLVACGSTQVGTLLMSDAPPRESFH